jgi:aspartyl-tRNA(Asn)/glutamyl-tRNA(Gln) amidotransferase subunit A
MKPTYGLVSVRGVFPLAMSLDHVGPMTRTVEDNAILLDAIAGPDAADPLSAQRKAGDCLSRLDAGIKGVRIGVISHFHERDAEADAEQIAGLNAAMEVLRKLGADVTSVEVSPLAVWQDCYRVLVASESFAVHQGDMQARCEDFSGATRERVLPGAFITASKYIAAQQLRRRLSEEMQAAMRGLDAVVSLSGLYLPTPLEDSESVIRFYDRQCRMVFNITGTPAISVPTGRSKSGLPLAMQIAGHAFDESTVYRIAQAYCTAAGTMIGTDAASQPKLN